MPTNQFVRWRCTRSTLSAFVLIAYNNLAIQRERTRALINFANKFQMLAETRRRHGVHVKDDLIHRAEIAFFLFAGRS